MERFIFKCATLLLFLAIIVIVQEIVKFINCFMTMQKYELKQRERIITYVSLSYILTIIFTGLL